MRKSAIAALTLLAPLAHAHHESAADHGAAALVISAAVIAGIALTAWFLGRAQRRD
ncbi:MAG: hypothetical protein AAF515_00195 [Pseudomonadota bacterium]